MFSKKSLESNIKKGFGGSEIRKSIEKALPGEEGKEILRIGKHNLIKNMILDVAKKSLPFTGATIGGIYALGKLSMIRKLSLRHISICSNKGSSTPSCLLFSYVLERYC